MFSSGSVKCLDNLQVNSCVIMQSSTEVSSGGQTHPVWTGLPLQVLYHGSEDPGSEGNNDSKTDVSCNETVSLWYQFPSPIVLIFLASA